MSHAAQVLSAPSRRGLSKAAAVYEHLRTEIVRLRLPPGGRLDKAEICRSLGVSRQPLAEAIARLAEERLVDVEPQKGTFVARIRMADVAEANFLRRSLEIATVQAIAERMEDVIVQRLDRLLAYQEAAVAADDVEEFYGLDVRFHLALFDVLAMRRVAEVVETSRAQLERARRLLIPKPGRINRTVEEHRAIHLALAARDPRGAAEAMAAHLDVTMAELKEFSTRRPDIFEI
ncbi:GntR family transcriptional regulator [Bauldia litoralis]|uniref:GntR family transcriptional regulator n=1 Tax=Bauldia litoralis TaxID=665467 RepID=UPI003264F4B8